MSRSLPLCLALSASLLAFSCSKVGEMHDATLEMKAKTGTLSDSSEEMKYTMGELFDSGRQGAALDLRTKMYENLLQAERLEDKGTYAVFYFLAFEFQLWSNLGIDAQQGGRERLMKDAADEFNRVLGANTHWDDSEIDPFAGKNPVVLFKKTENERAVFNALAAAVEHNNRKQKNVPLAPNLEEISMLKMIETMLLASKQIREGKAKITDFPEYVDVLRQKEHLYIRLLQARHNVLGLTVLAQLTPMTQNLREGFKYKVWGKNWDIDFQAQNKNGVPKLNDSVLALATYRLKEAVHARDVLKEIGVEPMVNEDIQGIYDNASVKHAPDEALAASQPEQAKSANEFLEALSAYLERPLPDPAQ